MHHIVKHIIAQPPQYILRQKLRIQRRNQSQGRRSQPPNVLIPIFQFFKRKMSHKNLVIIFKARHIKPDVQIRILPQPKREIVSLRQNLNSIRKTSLSPNVLLKGGGRRPSAIHLPIEQANQQQMLGQFQHVGAQNFRVVRPREGPGQIAGRIPHVLPDRVISLIHVVNQGLVQHRENLRDSLREQQPPPAKLGDGQTPPVPAAFALVGQEQLKQGWNHVVRHV